MLPVEHHMDKPGLWVYHHRALQLADAMKLCRDDLASYAAGAAILAVHSAISYNDALLFKLSGKSFRGQDHSQAVTAIKKECARAKIKPEGVTHLNTLVREKTNVSYGENRVEDGRIKALCITAERFQAWAERLLKG